MRVIALLQARDEERFISGWLENVTPAVDGFVALDDGSTDATVEILRRHPKLLDLLQNPPGLPWDERANQIALVEAGRSQGADWLLCVDADERLETRFVEQCRAVLGRAERDGLRVLRFVLRELWGDPHHYRVDGVWSQKTLCRLFRILPEHRRYDPRKLHRFWMPMELVVELEQTSHLTDFNLYHLRMIDPADREARVARYAALDPHGLYQKLGYRYLTDTTGLQLEAVPPDRDYRPRY